MLFSVEFCQKSLVQEKKDADVNKNRHHSNIFVGESVS